MKITVVWDVDLCSLVDITKVSKEPATSIFRVTLKTAEGGGSRFV
jgi:hypothetical protein